MERNNHGDCTTNQAAFDAFCDQSPESPGHTCALSILEAAALGSSLFGCVGHRARRLHMGLPQNDQRKQQIPSFLVLESTILNYAYIFLISTQVFSITLVDFADRSCCRWTAVVLTRCMWPGLDVPTLAGVKGHGGHESRCQVPFRNVLKACLVFFSSNRRPEASVGLRRCEGVKFPAREGWRTRPVPLRIVDSSQKRRKMTLQHNLV